MIHAIAAALETWRDDPAVHLVVVEGAGDRAFCAGGDMRTHPHEVLDGDHDAVEAFFVHEYALNRRSPAIRSLHLAIDGICMGGGIGVSVHGSIRVASEHAQFAMPETQVGFSRTSAPASSCPGCAGSSACIWA